MSNNNIESCYKNYIRLIYNQLGLPCDTENNYSTDIGLLYTSIIEKNNMTSETNLSDELLIASMKKVPLCALYGLRNRGANLKSIYNNATNEEKEELIQVYRSLIECMIIKHKIENIMNSFKKLNTSYDNVNNLIGYILNINNYKNPVNAAKIIDIIIYDEDIKSVLKSIEVPDYILKYIDNITVESIRSRIIDADFVYYLNKLIDIILSIRPPSIDSNGINSILFDNYISEILSNSIALKYIQKNRSPKRNANNFTCSCINKNYKSKEENIINSLINFFENYDNVSINYSNTHLIKHITHIIMHILSLIRKPNFVNSIKSELILNIASDTNIPFNDFINSNGHVNLSKFLEYIKDNKLNIKMDDIKAMLLKILDRFNIKNDTILQIVSELSLDDLEITEEMIKISHVVEDILNKITSTLNKKHKVFKINSV